MTERLCTRHHFEKEAKDNSEMAYSENATLVFLSSAFVELETRLFVRTALHPNHFMKAIWAESWITF